MLINGALLLQIRYFRRVLFLGYGLERVRLFCTPRVSSPTLWLGGAGGEESDETHTNSVKGVPNNKSCSSLAIGGGEEKGTAK